MKSKNRGMRPLNPVTVVIAPLALLATVLMAPSAMAQITLDVQGVDNCVPLAAACEPTYTTVTGFRWQVEEDKTYHVQLDGDGNVERDGSLAPVIDPNWRVGPDGLEGTLDDDPLRNTVSVSFHHSYMPVVTNGHSSDADMAAKLATLDPAKNYYVSILPDDGYSMGGAMIRAGDDGAVRVYVNSHPIPTAQITVRVFQDAAPINNVWDQGEVGLEGFAIILEDAGGKYGASAGIQSQDVFGNLLCTEYEFFDTNNNGTHDPGELFQMNNDGEPIVARAGSGCVTGPDGIVSIRNLSPGKFGVLAVPPAAIEVPPDSGNYVSSNYTQTSTIEGKKLIDAWVKANEPNFFGEFGPPGPHVNIGFVTAGPDKPFIDATVLTGGATISGQVVNLHLSRPPDTAFYNGGPFPHTTPWVGLNLGAAGLGRGVYAARANDDGSFAIPNVPAGAYQLVVWDDNLDLLFAKSTVIVNDGASTCNLLTSCNLGDVPVFQWFARMEAHVYNDENEDGFRDAGENGIIEQGVNLRFRDGTIYQAFPTDGDGFAPFDEVFPFFSWLVAEVDFARFKATGLTVTVDDGGPIDGTPGEGSGSNWDRVLSPQTQQDPTDPDSFVPPGCAGDDSCRSELGPVLSQGIQAFLGQTNVLEFGKREYWTDGQGRSENGGISGVVMYAVTRAEDNPEQAAAEPWEPGIPDVTVNLLSWPGGKLLASTTTDSWDGSRPTNCQYGSNAGSATDDPFVFRGVDTDCYDGMRMWNQVRPGVFDGGYAFGPEIDCSVEGTLFVDRATCLENTHPVFNPRTGGGTRYLNDATQYIVEVVPPAGYEVIKSQDRNVDFGEPYFPSPEKLAPACVGADYVVPASLSLFPEPAPLADQILKLCDRKEVALQAKSNGAADFFLFTQVPIAGHFIGFILDDTANEFDPASPQFGEKYAPPFMPVSIRDWTGREISRTVSDEYGVYNALIPSTYTESLGKPSGISPSMLTTCMNAKSKPNPAYDPVTSNANVPQFIDDPLHNPQYSQFCYTFQYMPGSTTYLDTPVVPVAAFAGPDQNPLDCEFVTQTPQISRVEVLGNGVFGGPYAPDDSPRTVRVFSQGWVDVPNPAYTGVGGTEPKTIQRNYGFGGTDGTVTIGGVPQTISFWNNNRIDVTMAPGTTTGQLMITRGDSGISTEVGVTVQVGLRSGANVLVVDKTNGGAYQTIQAAINDAGNNDLILVAPGTYDELVVMWKPVQLQGFGAGSTFINAIKTPFNKLSEWRQLTETLVTNNLVDIVPGQELAFGGIEPAIFFGEEGAGVFVLAKKTGGARFERGINQGARIDGFTISGADTGGGIAVNGYANYLEISNNRVVNNSAFYAGGVRVGHAVVTNQVCPDPTRDGCFEYTDSENDFVKIHHNIINQNGGLTGAGGGIGLHNGTDSYEVTDNFVCGNFTTASGAGIAHYGLSHRAGSNENGPLPLIADNTIIFNENFNQGLTVNGGGILVEGLPGLGCLFDPATGLQNPKCLANQTQTTTAGTGSVNIYRNLIQGNSAGVGEGAGIRLARVNGQDVDVKQGEIEYEYRVWIYNNMIVDNVAGLAGGGISIQDALDVRIWHNTIAHNDNASTSGDAFTPGIPDHSNPQPGAGVVSHAHSADLAPWVEGLSLFSDPNMRNNIIWENRKFFWQLEDSLPTIFGLCPDIGGELGLTCGLPDGNAPVFDDLAVLGTATPQNLSCNRCVITDGAGINNATEGPDFVAEYFNGARNDIVIVEGTISMNATPAFDEGGNFIRLRYGPLTLRERGNINPANGRETSTGALFGDYHLQPDSFGIDRAAGSNASDDFDGDPRLTGGAGNNVNDIGADEVQ